MAQFFLWLQNGMWQDQQFRQAVECHSAKSDFYWKVAASAADLRDMLLQQACWKINYQYVREAITDVSVSMHCLVIIVCACTGGAGQ